MSLSKTEAEVERRARRARAAVLAQSLGDDEQQRQLRPFEQRWLDEARQTLEEEEHD